MMRLPLMLAMKARDGGRQRTLSQQTFRNEKSAALPSREAKTFGDRAETPLNLNGTRIMRGELADGTQAVTDH
jgi:hypothetical protein